MHPALPKQLRPDPAYAPVPHQPWTSHPGTPTPAQCWQSAELVSFLRDDVNLTCLHLIMPNSTRIAVILCGVKHGPAPLSPAAPEPTKVADAAPPAAAAKPAPAVVGSALVHHGLLCSTCSFMAGMIGIFCWWYVLSLPQQHPPARSPACGGPARDTQSPKLNIIQPSEERERQAPPAPYGGLGQGARGPGKDQAEGETGGGNSTKGCLLQ